MPRGSPRSWSPSAELSTQRRSATARRLLTAGLRAPAPAPAALRHLAQLRHVIAHGSDEVGEACVVGLAQLRRARHDPDVIAGLAGDHGLAVVVGQVGDAVVSLDRPYELHSPHRVRGPVHHESARRIESLRPVEAACVERERRGDGAVGIELVGLDRVPGVPLDVGGNGRDHVPVAHEPLEIDVLYDGYRRTRQAAAAGNGESGDRGENLSVGHGINAHQSS